MSTGRAQFEHSPSPALVAWAVEHIWDPVELKTLLTVSLLGGETRPVDETSIIDATPLTRGAHGDGSARPPRERIRNALSSVVARGILVALTDDEERSWYIVASAESRSSIYAGEYSHDEGTTPRPLRVERPDVFGLYEQNIGLVTPIVAERLTEALETYPESWIGEAIGEAVAYNRRNWRYIQRILENWATEGRSSETNRRDHEGHLDREKYISGKYGPHIRRR